MNMLKMVRAFFQRVRSDEEGVTAIEYGLIATLIGVAIITAVTSVGTSLKSEFGTISSDI
jgi:pilus assembly protein Flp/PilA